MDFHQLDEESLQLSRDDTFITSKSSLKEEQTEILSNYGLQNFPKDDELAKNTIIEPKSMNNDTLYCSFGEKLDRDDSEETSISANSQDFYDVILIWSKNYIFPRLFSKINKNIRFVAITILPNTEVLKLMEIAQKHDFHFVERSVIVNSTPKDDKVEIPWKQIMIFRRGKLLSFDAQRPNYSWPDKNINHQVDCDVVFSNNSTISLMKFKEILQKLCRSKHVLVTDLDCLLENELHEINAIFPKLEQLEVKPIEENILLNKNVNLETTFLSKSLNQFKDHAFKDSSSISSRRITSSGLVKIGNIIKNAVKLTDASVDQLQNATKFDKIVFNNGNNDIVKDDALEEEVGYGENTEFNDADEKEIKNIIKEKMQALRENLKKVRAKLPKKMKTKIKDSMINQLEVELLLRWEAFGTENSTTRVSNLTPIKVELSSDAPDTLRANPIFPKGRAEKEFMVKKVRQMEKAGLVRVAEYPKYCCAAFPVLKPVQIPGKPARYRLVMDMRCLNRYSQKTPLVLPNLEEQLMSTEGSVFFAKFDILNGFDYLPTHIFSRCYFCFLTSFSAYEMLGAPQGWTNTPAYFSTRIYQEILFPAGLLGCDEDLRQQVLQWIDDSLVHGQTWEQFLDRLCRLLDAFIKKKVRLSVTKCEFLKTTIEWCGRIISEDGWKYPSKYFRKILQTPRPVYAHEMAQAIYVANWLSLSIPNLAKLRLPFQHYTNLKGKKLIDLTRRKVLIEWSPDLKKDWSTFVTTLANSARSTLALYNPSSKLCIFTDASQTTWSLVIAMGEFDSSLPFSIDTHKIKPMFYLSGTFQNSSELWDISQKELWPLIKAYSRFNYLLNGHEGEIHFFTDHRNLTFILRPQWSEKMSYYNRLRRWGLILQHLKITVHHISSYENSLADMLTRWARVTDDDSSIITLNSKLFTLNRLQGGGKRKEVIPNEKTIELFNKLDKHRLSFIHPFYEDLWVPPTEQATYVSQLNWFNNLTKEEVDYYIISQDLKTKLFKINELIIVTPILVDVMLAWIHVVKGHVSETKEKLELSKYFWILPEGSKIIDFALNLRNHCLHCRRVPKLIPRPLGLTDIAKKPREILHADYLFIEKKLGYILVILDNYSRKIKLRYCGKATSFNMAQGLLEWRASFSFLEEFLLVTDNASHFAAKLLKQMEIALRMSHKWSVANSPFTNGQIEVVNSPILTAIQQLASEYLLPIEQWPLLLPLVEHLINSSPSKRRLNFTPNQLFLGLEQPAEPVLSASFDLKTLGITHDGKKWIYPKNVEVLQNSIKTIQNSILEKTEKVFSYVELMRTRELRNINKNRVNFQFIPGDWILFSVAETPRNKSKLELVWHGPFMVEEVIGENVYKIRSPTNKTYVTHSHRMWFYDSSTFKLHDSIKNLFAINWKSLHVKHILQHRISNYGLEFLISWLGFTSDDDTWQDAKQINEEVPQKVEKYLNKLKTDEKEKVLKHLKLVAINKVNLLLDKNEESRDILPVSIDTIQIQFENTRFKSKLVSLMKEYVNYNKNNYHTDLEIYKRPERAGLGFVKERDHKFKVDLTNRQWDIPIQAIYRPVVEITKGWTTEEEDILHKCTLKYGCGMYKVIIQRNYILGKNRQQMFNKLQRWTNCKAIQQFHGLHIDLNDIYKANVDGQLNQRELDLNEQQAKKKLDFEKPKSYWKDLEIPFYRRWLIPSHRSKTIEDVKQGLIIPEEDLKKLIREEKKWKIRQKRVKNYVLRVVQNIVHDRQEFRNGKVIKEVKETKFNLEYPKIEGFINNHIFRSKFTVETAEGKVFIQELEDNYYEAFHELDPVCKFEFFLQPKGSKWKKIDLFNLSGNVFNDYEAIIMDPPWPLNGSNPVRGPAITYEVPKLKDIFNLNLEDFQTKGIIGVWVINLTYFKVLKWLEKNNYKYIKEIHWIKITKNKKLAKSTGHYLQHATETCVLAYKEIKKPKLPKFRNNHVMFSPRKLQSQKPNTIHEIFENLKQFKSFCELFGRSVNLRKNWITMGKQVIPQEKECWIYLRNKLQLDKESAGSIVLNK